MTRKRRILSKYVFLVHISINAKKSETPNSPQGESPVGFLNCLLSSLVSKLPFLALLNVCDFLVLCLVLSHEYTMFVFLMTI